MLGKEQIKKMKFWTKPKYLKFTEAIMDKSVSYYVFEISYWDELRLGELLALIPYDFNFEKQTVRIPTNVSIKKCNYDSKILKIKIY